MRWCSRGHGAKRRPVERRGGVILEPALHPTPSRIALHDAQRPRERLSLDERLSPPVEDEAGNEKHCRHRQRLRKCFRRRPLGGFVHADLPRLGHDSSLRGSACNGHIFTRNTPRRIFALTSPHSANIDHAKVDQQYGGILARVQPTCARVMEFRSRRDGRPRTAQAVARASVARYCFQRKTAV